MRQALKLAAMNLSHSDSALGAFNRRLSGRLDKPCANTATATATATASATAHKLARMVYFRLTWGKS